MEIINKIKLFVSQDNSKGKLSSFSKTLMILQSLLVFSIITFDNWRYFHLLTYVFLFIIVILITIRFISKKRIILPDYKLFYFLLFFAYVVFITVLKSRAFGTLITSFGSIVLIFVSYYVFLIVGNFRKTLLSLIVPITLFSIIFCFVYRAQILSFDFSNRLGSFFSNENTLAITFNLGFFISLIFIFFGTKKALFLLPLPIVFAFCSLFTGSRKGILMFLLVLLVVAFIRFWHKKIIIISFSVGIICLIIVFFSIPALAPIRDRFIGTFAIFAGNVEMVDGSSALRYRMLLESFYGGLEDFWIGNGIDGFRLNTIYGTYSHNNLGEMLYDFGAIGLTLYYLPFIISFFNSKKDYQSKSFVYGFATIIILFSFSSVFYYDKLMSVFIGLLIVSSDINGLFDRRIIKNNYYSFEV